ncbi:MAG: hypothetical protein WBD26_19380, partial [Candidatus Acidiferrales bacterium]
AKNVAATPLSKTLFIFSPLIACSDGGGILYSLRRISQKRFRSRSREHPSPFVALYTMASGPSGLWL